MVWPWPFRTSASLILRIIDSVADRLFAMIQFSSQLKILTWKLDQFFQARSQRTISNSLIQHSGATVSSGAPTGAVTLIQRFGSAFNLNVHVHMHMLFLDVAVPSLASGSSSTAPAGLDVFIDEPLPLGCALLAMDNVLLSPHIGCGTGVGQKGRCRHEGKRR